jgi:Flp pilus assembly protein TadD
VKRFTHRDFFFEKFRPGGGPRLAALAFAVVLASAPALAESAAGADAALARAREMLAAGQLYPAEQAARDAIEREPDRADAHRLLGQILVRRRKPALAVAELERAAELAPQTPGLDRELGLARFDAGDFEGARVAIGRALASDPEDALLHLRLGQCEMAQGRPERAVPEFERAARDPELREVAQSHLAAANEEGRAREDGSLASAPDSRPALPGAFERAIDKPWRLTAGAGLLYDSNVRRPELDTESGEGDGAGQFEAAASYELPVRNWFDLQAGYDFYQSLYFDLHEFDLQSHMFRVAASRQLTPKTDASLAYLYSLNRLDDHHFLDYHEVRPAVGFSPTPWWYASAAPALRIKRFFGDSLDRDRDAETPVIGTLQLFALGSWERHLLLGIDGEFENADGRQFDYNGFSALAGLKLPIPIVERRWRLDLRYRYRHRDYQAGNSSPFGTREDRIHSGRARLEIPIAPYTAFRVEYEYEDATSNLPSADYTAHTIGGSLRFEL